MGARYERGRDYETRARARWGLVRLCGYLEDGQHGSLGGLLGAGRGVEQRVVRGGVGDEAEERGVFLEGGEGAVHLEGAGVDMLGQGGEKRKVGEGQRSGAGWGLDQAWTQAV